MSSIPIVKGFPASMLVTLRDDDTIVDVNNGDWAVTAELHYQTKNGPEPFTITPSPAQDKVLIEFTDEQTNMLNHLGLGYVLVVQALKSDDTASVQAEIPVSVRDGL